MTGVIDRGASLSVHCGRKAASMRRGEPERRGTALAVRTDVRWWKDVRHTADETVDRFSRIDALVNNAGVASISLADGEEYAVTEIPVETWETVSGTNLTGRSCVRTPC